MSRQALPAAGATVVDIDDAQPADDAQLPAGNLEAVVRPAVHRESPRHRGPVHGPAAARINYATHKTPAIRDWLMRHPRFTLHFTPASLSWLNLVERWFAELTNRKLRRSSHTSVKELQTDLRAWADAWNQNPRPFVWTKTADEILDTITTYLQLINDSGH